MAQITPEEYRAEVVEYSLALKIKNNNVTGAVEAVKLAKTGLLPSLSAEGNINYLLREISGQHRWAWGVQPAIYQTIYAGGGLRAAYNKARLETEIALCDAEFTMLEVCYAADYAYWNLLAMEKYLSATKEYVAIISSLKEAIEWRFSEGYVAKGDLLMILSRLSEAEYLLVSAEQSHETALHNFNSLRGHQSGANSSLSPPVLTNTDPPARVSTDELTGRRPDYISADLYHDVTEVNIKSVRSQYNPQLDAAILGGWSRESPMIGGGGRVDGAVGLTLSLPIFQFGARSKAVAIARISEQNAELAVAQLRDAILLEESNGWTNITRSEAQLHSARRSLEIAGENLEISTFSYREGLTTIVDVMQAQLSWMQIYTNSIESEFNFLVAISAYDKIVAKEPRISDGN